MSEQNQADESTTAQAPGGPGDPGDVETAGETTAAAAIKGPDDKRPVGSGTTAPVEGDAGTSRPKAD